jgi:N-acetylmuramoyl-L-alanine amidase
MTGEKLLRTAQSRLGCDYLLGALVPKNDPDYMGAFDCAELGSWAVYQVGKFLYGCANNAGNPGGADAYSGFWARDAQKLGIIVSIAVGIRTPGAFLLRIAGHGIIGHLAVSVGGGSTIEAHSRARGVTIDKVNGRRWDYAVLIPGFEYNELATVRPEPPTDVIYRFVLPMMRHDDIKKIQKALGKIRVDGIFGRQTHEAVKAFQVRTGLVADGEVGPMTWAALIK